MSDQPDPPEKKIIIDEDWKSKVEAEREEAVRTKASKEGEDTQAGQKTAEPEAGTAEDMPLPPPTLESLVSTLAMQTMVALGLVPDPAGGKTVVHLSHAKHFIDTIAMLEEKTQGNRTSEETAVFDNVLHELRMGYVAIQQQAGEQKE
jgi:hypothetical protein